MPSKSIIYLFFAFFSILTHVSFAQNCTITVMDEEKNTPIEGLLLTIKGKNTKGTEIYKVTDAQGQASISINDSLIEITTSHLAYLPFTTTLPLSSQITLALKPQDYGLNPVVITATRTERLASSLSTPISVISRERIQKMGSLRLTDILNEQTGFAVMSQQLANTVGVPIPNSLGVQMQGLSAEYTLILIDGEPMIGRTGGAIQLSRIATKNIKQVEIIKGPSSALYGNDALAGVINIITQQPTNAFSTNIQTRYSSYNQLDLNADVSFKKDKWKGYFFANRYSSSGYDLDKETIAKTAPPSSNYTFQSKIGYDLNSKMKLSLAGRYFTESQQDKMEIIPETNPQKVLANYQAQQKDWNVALNFIYTPSKLLKLTVRDYVTGFNTDMALTDLENNTSYLKEDFKQYYNRPEIQAEYILSEKNTLTAGTGYIFESLNAARYDGFKDFYTLYGFLQDEWHVSSKINLTAGARFDKHSVYGAQLSPKFSLQYNANRWLSVQGSVGKGFRAPDFRQLYLNFSNPAIGYNVVGAATLPTILAQLEALGDIQNYLLDVNTLNNLRAESSWSYNAGFRIKVTPKITWQNQFFRNDVSEMIERVAVALKKNGQNVFSYANLNRVFTQGVESELNWQLAKGLQISSGYQWLAAKDKNVVKKIKEGKLIRNEIVIIDNKPTQQESKVLAEDYIGLMGRSRHMANFKIFYENTTHHFDLSLRGIYRSKFGFRDINANTIADIDEEYIKGYVTWNASVGKQFFKTIRLQGGIDNIMNVRNENIPAMPGRIYYISLNFLFNKN